MTIMVKKLNLVFLLLYLLGVIVLLSVTYRSVQAENNQYLVQRYQEHFRITETYFNNIFKEIENDLLTLSDNEVVKNPKDEDFTSFLSAEEATFQYEYSEAELAIIKIFHDTLKNYPHFNSVYMGRENGTFIRAVPRTKPTQYDPRVRPWYLSAMRKPGSVQMTSAYSSLTNTDINIAFSITIQDEMNRPYGVVGIDVTLNELSKELSEMDLVFDGRMDIVDAAGTILISSFDNHINKKYNHDASYEKIGSYDGMLVERNSEYYRLTYSTDLYDGPFIAYAPVTLVEEYQNKILRQRLIISLLILMVIEGWSLFLIRYYVNKPIRAMTKALKESRNSGIPDKMDVNVSGELEEFQVQYNDLVERLNRDEEEFKKARELTVTSLASLTAMRDFETGLHLVRTSKYVELLSEEYNKNFPDESLPFRKVEMMIQCAPLHDIGKVAIADEILQKPGSLTEQEFELMKKHTMYGKMTLEKYVEEVRHQLFVDTAINMVYSHHERWDGGGYPEGISGVNIPIEARIMSLADAYDAITSSRVYKAAASHETATSIIKEMSGKQFDPYIVRVFLSIEEKMKEIAETYRD